MTRWLLLAALLSSCVTAPEMPVTQAAALSPPGRPGRPAEEVVLGNPELARDALELAFRLESGRALPVLTRFEEPVTVRLVGSAPTVARDLSELIARLRDEARIDIRPAAGGEDASITVQMVSRRAVSRELPGAACFVAPGVSSWPEYRAARGSAGADWTKLTTRTRAAIFIPADVAPQEMRDCLHEELAQALGPVGDLYRLTGSVFNDDNFHAVLTRTDMLILRALYDDALSSGLSEREVARRLPAILDRINPAGRRGGAPAPAPRDPAWEREIQRALVPGDEGSRRAGAARALARAEEGGWTDARAAFSLYVWARLNMERDAARAGAALERSRALYAALPGTSVQLAHVDLQRGAVALAEDNPSAALAIAEGAIPVATRARNAALLASLHAVRGAALDALGRPGPARRARAEGRRWSAYGFGAVPET